MTAKQAIKKLQAIVAQHGNVKVGVDWKAARDSSNLGDEFTVLPVGNIEIDVLLVADDYGGIAYTKAGVERTRKLVVIS